MTRVIVEADGGSRGNPGPAGYGAVVLAADGTTVLAERKGSLGIATNNVAEYNGLVAGLQAAAELGADAVAVRMDSKLVVEQMSGRWQIKHPDLRPLARRANELRRAFSAVQFDWIPREKNKRADRLANEAMDEAMGISRPSPRTPRPAPTELDELPDEPARPGGWVPPADEVPTRLVLLRHGRTAHTAEMRFAGHTDMPLDEVGRRQAEAAGRRVARFAPVAAIVSSPLLRTRQTAAAAARALGRDESAIVVEPGFAETNFGAWEALTRTEIVARWNDEFSAWTADHDLAPPDGESFSDVTRRVRRARDLLLRTYPAQTIVVVTHVVPIKALLRTALNGPPEVFRLLHLDAACVSVIDYYSTGTSIVRTVNEGAFDLDGVATTSDAEGVRA